LAFRNEDFEQALAFADKALQLSPDNIEAHYQKGAAMVSHALYGSGYISSEEQKIARRHLKKMLLSNGDHPGAHLFYALSHGNEYRAPNKQSVASAEYALSYFLTPDFSGPAVNLGTILMLGESFDAARAAAEFALVWSKEPMVRSRAKELIKEIEAKQVRLKGR